MSGSIERRVNSSLQLEYARPDIICRDMRIDFIIRTNAALMPIQDFKTPCGYVNVSTMKLQHLI